MPDQYQTIILKLCAISAQQVACVDAVEKLVELIGEGEARLRALEVAIDLQHRKNLPESPF